MRIDESMREKRYRYIVLTVVILGVILAFYFQSQKFEQLNQVTPESNQLVSIIKPLTDFQNPLVALAKWHKGEPLLLLYTMDRHDYYKFEVLHVKELDGMPQAMESEDEQGVWMDFDGEWVFFDENLESQSGEKTKQSTPIQSYEIQIEENHRVNVYTHGSILWSEQFDEEPISVQPLSKDYETWLLVFRDDLMVYEL